MNVIAITLAHLFAIIGLLHIYWALGGHWGGRVAIPKHADGRPAFTPGPVACLIVALGLLFFAYVPLAHTRFLPDTLLPGHTRLALVAMAGVFGLRTIGDFKFVGFTRRIRGTDFARYDRMIFSPLCALITAALGYLAAFPAP